MCKVNHLPSASPERLLVSAVRDRVSPSLADWIGTRIVHGADIDEVERQMSAAAAQIARVRNHYAREAAE
jgi:hypothetical protein